MPFATTRNERLWLGLVALVLVLGLLAMLAGCPPDPAFFAAGEHYFQGRNWLLSAQGPAQEFPTS